MKFWKQKPCGGLYGCESVRRSDAGCAAISDCAGEGASESCCGRKNESIYGSNCVPEPAEYGTEVISVDAAFKDAETNDYVSIQVWGKRGNDYYLRYCMNRHLDFPNTVTKIREVAQLYPNARLILIEQAANGAAIISVLQKELNVVPVTPQGGKVSRVNAVAPVIESGHVYLPDPEVHPWVTEYVNQWTVFPNGKHDDMVDASTQALSRLFRYSGEAWIEQPVNDRSDTLVDM